MPDIADWVDYHTWMICPFCRGDPRLLVRKNEGRYCPKCSRKILSLCNRAKK